MPDLAAFLAAHRRIVRVRVQRARGSAPREAGAWMLVAGTDSFATIGGGQMEFRAIEAARRMLAEGTDRARLDMGLGPEIGQCCGGRVEIVLERLSEAARATLLHEAEAAQQARPHVLIFGAGHVGRALAACTALLPVNTVLIDSRKAELDRCTAPVDRRLTPLPEAEIARAPQGSAHVILTHDHGLDFQLAAAALGRGDAAYVGMIGSASKRAQFRRFLAEAAPGVPAERLICPIGAGGARDKRPEVIAAFVAAEIMAALGPVASPVDIAQAGSA